MRLLLLIVALVATTPLGVHASAAPPATATKDILTAFYYAFDGPQWVVDTNWLVHDPCCADPPVCSQTWLMLTCDGSNVVSFLTDAVGMAGNLTGAAVLCGLPTLSFIGIFDEPGIYGSVPPCFGSMANLTELALNNIPLDPAPFPPFVASGPAPLVNITLTGVSLTGPFPDALSARASTLMALDLSVNSLSGTLPSWLAQMDHIVYLTLRNNLFTGTVPPGILALPNVNTVDVSMNQLHGTIPDAFVASSRLSVLQLAFNNLTGTLPPSMAVAVASPLTDAWVLSLSYNPLLGGPLDVLFPPGSKLFSLDAASCAFSGPLPASLSNARSLVSFVVHNNKLTGALPASLGHFRHLLLADLSDNDFSTVDAGLVIYNSSITALKLRGNRLTKLPPLFHIAIEVEEGVLQSCAWTSSLTFVDICANPLRSQLEPELTGLTIPDLFDLMVTAELGGFNAVLGCVNTLGVTFPGLSFLGLTNLHLRGPLPALPFQAFAGISHLDVSSNNLTGPLPRSSIVIPFALPWSLSFLDLSSNAGLSGPLPLAFASALTANLYYLNIKGTNISNGNSLPAFLVPQPESVTNNIVWHYSCPGVTNLAGSARVDVDPYLYNMSLCSCTAGFWGAITLDHIDACRPITSYCADGKVCASNEGERNASAASVLRPLAGYFPSPSLELATTLLKCANVPVLATSLACNPDTKLTCTALPVLPSEVASFTCGPSQAVCRPGYTGRVCSRCDVGFVPTVDGCAPCTSTILPSEWVVFVRVVLTMVCLVASLSLRVQSTSLERLKLRRKFHAAPSVAGFLGAFGSELIHVSLIMLSITAFAALTAVPLAMLAVVFLLFLLFSVYSLIRRSIPFDLGASMAEARAEAERHAPEREESRPLLGGGGGSINRAATYFGMRGSARGGSGEAAVMGGFLGDTPVSEVREALAVVQGLIKSLIVYVQTVEAVTRSVVVWPSWMGWIVMFNDMVLSVRASVCADPWYDYENSLVAVMALPMLVLGFALLIYLVWVGAVRGRTAWRVAAVGADGAVDAAIRVQVIKQSQREKVRSISNLLVSVTVLVLYVMLFPVLLTYFSLFACEMDPTPKLYPDADQDQYLINARWIKCFSGRPFFRMFIPASALFTVYCCVYGALFRRVRKHAKAGELRLPSVLERYSILYESFRPSVWWFEEVLTVRRIAVAVTLATTTTESYRAVTFMIVLLVASLGVQGWLDPYSTALGNLMELVALSSLVITYVVSQTALRLFQSASSASVRLEGPSLVLNDLAVANTIATLTAYTIIVTLTLVRLVPAVRRQRFRIFRTMGLDTTPRIVPCNDMLVDVASASENAAVCIPPADDAAVAELAAEIDSLRRALAEERQRAAGAALLHAAELAAAAAAAAGGSTQ